MKLENMLDKLIITALRGKTAAVLFKDGHAAQIDFEPEAAEEETGVIFVGKVKNISKNINAAFVEYRPGVNGLQPEGKYASDLRGRESGTWSVKGRG